MDSAAGAIQDLRPLFNQLTDGPARYTVEDTVEGDFLALAVPSGGDGGSRASRSGCWGSAVSAVCWLGSAAKSSFAFAAQAVSPGMEEFLRDFSPRDEGPPDTSRAQRTVAVVPAAWDTRMMAAAKRTFQQVKPMLIGDDVGRLEQFRANLVASGMPSDARLRQRLNRKISALQQGGGKRRSAAAPQGARASRQVSIAVTEPWLQAEILAALEAEEKVKEGMDAGTQAPRSRGSMALSAYHPELWGATFPPDEAWLAGGLGGLTLASSGGDSGEEDGGSLVEDGQFDDGLAWLDAQVAAGGLSSLPFHCAPGGSGAERVLQLGTQKAGGAGLQDAGATLRQRKTGGSGGKEGGHPLETILMRWGTTQVTEDAKNIHVTVAMEDERATNANLADFVEKWNDLVRGVEPGVGKPIKLTLKFRRAAITRDAVPLIIRLQNVRKLEFYQLDSKSFPFKCIGRLIGEMPNVDISGS